MSQTPDRYEFVAVHSGYDVSTRILGGHSLDIRRATQIEKLTR